MAYKNALRVETRWSFKDGHVSDRAQTKKVAEDCHLQRSNDVKVTKRLFTPETLAPLRAIRNESNQFLRLHTHPWDDKGGRLLPANVFQKFQAHVLRTQENLDEAKEDLSRSYDAIIDEAATRLNGLFRREDYPSVEDLLASYALRISYMPIAEADDLRLGGLSPLAEADLRSHVEEQVTEKLAEAHRANFERLLESMTLLADRLQVTMVNPTEGTAEYDADAPLVAAKSVFRDNTVQSVVDMLSVADDMNFTNDPALSELIARVRAGVKPDDLDPTVLRKDMVVRERVCAELEAAVQDITSNLPM